MSRISLSLSLLAVLAFTVSLSGCADQGDSPDPKPAKQDSAADHADHDHDDHADHDQGDHDDHADDQENDEDLAEIAKSLAKLSPADRAAAEKQKICPVSGELLGLTSTPLKVTVKGRDVFLCCQGCKSAFKKDPDKYLAKLT